MKTRTFSNNRQTWYSTVFVVLFIIQQILAFIWKPFNLVTPYWIVYLFVILIVAIQNWDKIVQKKSAYSFFIITVICAFFTSFNGEMIGVCVSKALCSFIGLVGFCYLSNHRIKLEIFDITLVVFYVFFFLSYYILDISLRTDIDDHLFGISSSNTIAITLNIIWVIYYIIARSYGKKIKQKQLLIYSLINLIAIVVQGSRIGILVAAINCLLSLSDVFNIKRIYFPIIMVLGGYLFLRYGSSLNQVMEYQQMQGLESYNEDVRSLAQADFISNLTLEHALFGFSETAHFAGWDRTFNAFLDFWRRYGILPFLSLIFLLIKRVVNNKRYFTPLIAFISIFLYSFFESFWGATLWDILIYIVLFYSNEKDFAFFENEIVSNS